MVLAAGQGKRMKSSLVKVLHPLRGRPLVAHVLEAVRGAGASRIVVVVGVQAALVRQRLAGEHVEFVEQGEPLGTAHAVLVARPALEGFRGDVLVVCGDTPLLDPADLRRLVRVRRETGAALALLTARAPDPTGYGRIVRDDRGRVRGIVEEADASPAQRRLDEINAGVYCFAAPRLWAVLEKVGRDNAQGEYYLTDAVGVLTAAGEEVVGVPAPWETVAGVSNRADLARLEAVLRHRCLDRLMREGVAVLDPASAFLGEGVRAEPDTVIEPGVVVEGRVGLRRGARVGPFTVLRESKDGG